MFTTYEILISSLFSGEFVLWVLGQKVKKKKKKKKPQTTKTKNWEGSHIAHKNYASPSMNQ